MRISDWSSDVCSSDLKNSAKASSAVRAEHPVDFQHQITQVKRLRKDLCLRNGFSCLQRDGSKSSDRSEEHTSELQSLMRISYAVFCLKKKKKNNMSSYSITLIRHLATKSLHA